MADGIRKARFRLANLRRRYKFLLFWWITISIAALIFAPNVWPPTPTEILYILLYLSFGILFLNAMNQELERADKLCKFPASKEAANKQHTEAI